MAVIVLVASLALSAGQASTTLKSASFQTDPGWDSRNNRQVPAVLPKVTQDFGRSRTSFASTANGEVGGTVVRATRPAFYAVKTAKTSNDPLSASGTFA